MGGQQTQGPYQSGDLVMPPNQNARMGPYTTQLSPNQEQEFRLWLMSNSDKPVIGNFNPNEVNSGYDMRGYWKALQAGDPRATSGVNPSDKTLHLTDVWKTPSHSSFSRESQYAMPNAPQWKGSNETGWYLQDKNGKVVYDERMSRDYGG